MTQPDEINSEFERRLYEQYREAAKEVPPPALDKRILDAARAAAAEPGAHARNEPALGKISASDFPVNDLAFSADRDDAPRARREEQRWGRPLALAAAVVLGIGIVVRVQMERPDMSPPGSEVKTAQAEAPGAPPPAPAAAPAPATVDAAAPAAAAPAQAQAPKADVARAPQASQADKAAAPEANAGRVLSKVAPPPSQGGADGERRQLAQAQEKKAASGYAGSPANQSTRSRLDPTMRDELAKEEAAAKMRESAANELKRLESASSAQGNVLASNSDVAAAEARGGILASRVPTPPTAAKPAEAPRPAAAAAPAAPAAPAVAAAPPPPAAAMPAPAPAAPQRAESAAATRGTDVASGTQPISPIYESDPDLWSRRIVDLRRNGRTAQADTELRRLRARYPGFKLPAEALPPQQ